MIFTTSQWSKMLGLHMQKDRKVSTVRCFVAQRHRCIQASSCLIDIVCFNVFVCAFGAKKRNVRSRRHFVGCVMIVFRLVWHKLPTLSSQGSQEIYFCTDTKMFYPNQSSYDLRDCTSRTSITESNLCLNFRPSHSWRCLLFILKFISFNV